MSIRLVLLVLLISTGAARAASREATLAGDQLSIDTPCVRHVSIEPDSALHGQVQVTATADHQAEIDRLQLQTEGHGAAIHTGPGGCWRQSLLPMFTSPTLTLAIRVPPATPLAITEAGAAGYAVGAVAGPLDLQAAGSVSFADAQVTRLAAALSGSAALSIGHADGDASIKLAGTGTASIDQAALASLKVEIDGAGKVTIARGLIGQATLNSSGIGTITIGATLRDASVEIDGVGTVRLARVTGTLSKTISGLGTVSVGN